MWIKKEKGKSKPNTRSRTYWSIEELKQTILFKSSLKHFEAKSEDLGKLSSDRCNRPVDFYEKLITKVISA